MKYFKKLRDLLELFLSLDFDKMVYDVSITSEFQRFAIDLNTKEQLFKQGINALGEDLASIGGSYSDYTIKIKIEDGLPYKFVTLYQSGNFYDSFEIEPFVGGFDIEADSDKENGDLVFRWGNEIVGLTDENKSIIARYYLDQIRKNIKMKLV